MIASGTNLVIMWRLLQLLIYILSTTVRKGLHETLYARWLQIGESIWQNSFTLYFRSSYIWFFRLLVKWEDLPYSFVVISETIGAWVWIPPERKKYRCVRYGVLMICYNLETLIMIPFLLFIGIRCNIDEPTRAGVKAAWRSHLFIAGGFFIKKTQCFSQLCRMQDSSFSD